MYSLEGFLSNQITVELNTQFSFVSPCVMLIKMDYILHQLMMQNFGKKDGLGKAHRGILFLIPLLYLDMVVFANHFFSETEPNAESNLSK